MNPKVSVIIPCYKVEAYLERCVESVLAQTLRDWEIILVDDESPDRVPEMCEKWAKRDSRIHVIHKKNEGLGMACNSGLEVATGKYVAFLDSDDWVDAEMYETLYKTAEQYKAQLVFSGLKRVDGSGGILMKMPHKETFILCRGKHEVNALACDMVASSPERAQERSLQMSAKVVLYNKLLIDKHQLRFESEREVASEDLIFNLDCLQVAESAVVLSESFYNYYANPASITGKSSEDADRFERYLQMRQTLLTRYKQQSKVFFERVDRMFIGYVRDQLLRSFQKSDKNIFEKRKLFLEISSHPIWSELRRAYPINKMPRKHREIFRCTINQSFLIFFIISQLFNFKSSLKKCFTNC